jgi:transposase
MARVDDRRVINGIFYVLRTGSPWRDLPERYGPYTTVYNRYNRWAKAGVGLTIFEMLSAKSGCAVRASWAECGESRTIKGGSVDAIVTA